MKIHPRQFISALQHIKTYWPKGCKCVLCTSVDNREELVHASKDFKEKSK